jgi:hypothetical protein
MVGAVDPMGVPVEVMLIVIGALKLFAGVIAKVTVSESLPVVPLVAGFDELPIVETPPAKKLRPGTEGLVAVAKNVKEPVVV